MKRKLIIAAAILIVTAIAAVIITQLITAGKAKESFKESTDKVVSLVQTPAPTKPGTTAGGTGDNPGTEKKDPEPTVYIQEKKDVEIVVPNKQGTGVEKKVVEVKPDAPEEEKKPVQQKVAEEVIKSSDDIIKLPDDVKIISTKIWNETLTIDFSKEVLNVKINDEKKEKVFIKSLVDSLLSSSVQGNVQAYTDIQFLVEGERVDHIFGSLNTRNPIMMVKLLK